VANKLGEKYIGFFKYKNILFQS